VTDGNERKKWCRKGLNADPAVLHHHARSFEYPERVNVVEIGDRFDS